MVARPSYERINKILVSKGYTSYLEIGVASGNTFFGINCEKKIAVDPNFKFNVDELIDNQKNTFFEKTTSDSFFETYDSSQKIDFIFLDGLHTFEQTYKDLMNSLEILSPGGAILIDDVFPLDFAGALKSISEMLAYRKTNNDLGPSAWWGDVYKVVLMMHDYHPYLDYRTLFDGKIQTVVRKSSFCPRLRLFPDLADLAQVDFYGIQKLREIYFEADLESVIDFLTE